MRLGEIGFQKSSAALASFAAMAAASDKHSRNDAHAHPADATETVHRLRSPIVVSNPG